MYFYTTPSMKLGVCKRYLKNTCKPKQASEKCLLLRLVMSGDAAEMHFCAVEAPPLGRSHKQPWI